MKTIKCKTQGRVLKIDTAPTLVSGNVDVTALKVFIDKELGENLSDVKVSFYDMKKEHPIIINPKREEDSSYVCLVPGFILARPGNFCFGLVITLSDGSTVTTNLVRYCVIPGVNTMNPMMPGFGYGEVEQTAGGAGIQSIEITKTGNLYDTYTIRFTNGETFDFNVRHSEGAAYTKGDGILITDDVISVDTDVIATKKDINTTLIELTYDPDGWPDYWSYPEGVSYETIKRDIKAGKEVGISYVVNKTSNITRIYQLESLKDNEISFGYHLGSTIEGITLYSDGTIKRTSNGSLTLKTDFTALAERVTTLEQTGAGKDGASAYDIWLSQGNEGTEADFLASLKGGDGDGYILTDEDKTEIAGELEAEIFVDAIKASPSFNLCDNKFEYGYINDNGTENDSFSPITVSYRTVNYLPVEGGRSVAFNINNASYDNTLEVAQYDADKNAIGTSLLVLNRDVNKYVNNNVALDPDTRYIRFTTYKTVSDLSAVKINLYYAENRNEAWTGDGDVFNYLPYENYTVAGRYIDPEKIRSNITGKKIVYDGDSICIGTYGGGGYAKIIADKTNGTFVNEAKGGATLTTRTDGGHSVVDNLPNLPADGDIYCFEGGINDYWTSVQPGTVDYESFDNVPDTTTVSGALETIFRYALTNFPGKPICFVITHKVSGTAYSDYQTASGYPFKAYRDVMTGICEKYSIPYYDAFSESGLNGWNTVQNNAYLTGNAEGTPDGCHPNEEGYKKFYVPQLLSLFERIMPTD